MTSSEEFEEEIEASRREGSILGYAYIEHRDRREALIKRYFETHTLEETSERFHSSHSYIVKVLGKAYLDSIQPEPEDKEDDEFGPINFGF